MATAPASAAGVGSVPAGNGADSPKPGRSTARTSKRSASAGTTGPRNPGPVPARAAGPWVRFENGVELVDVGTRWQDDDRQVGAGAGPPVQTLPGLVGIAPRGQLVEPDVCGVRKRTPGRPSSSVRAHRRAGLVARQHVLATGIGLGAVAVFQLL